MKKPRPSDIEELGFNLKMVVFVEVEPLSDVFEQLMLTPKLAAKIRSVIRTHSKRCKSCGSICLWVDEKTHYTFDDIKEEYEAKDIEKTGQHCPTDIR